MRNKLKLLLILAMLALAPDRVLAQETTYNCPLPGDQVCIDSITVVPATSVSGVSIDVHWLLVPANFGTTSADFFQIRYAYPGSPDTQVKLGGGSQGVYNLPLSATAVGGYTFKVQACLNGALGPATCAGGNQPPWDVEVFTLAAPPPPVAFSKRPTCPAGLKLVDSPCTCIPGLNQSSACDPSGTATCLSTAQLAKVPKCPGTQYLVCANLPAITSRDAAGTWFNKVTMSCKAVQASTSPDGKTGPPPKGTGLPVSNPANSNHH